MAEILLGGGRLELETLVEAARGGAKVRLLPEALERVVRARELVEGWVREGRAVYGVTTGFGALCNILISAEEGLQSQWGERPPERFIGHASP